MSFKKTLCKFLKLCSLVPLHPSGRREIPSRCLSSFVRSTRSFRSDVPQCLEALNCSRLHSSGHLSITFGRLSVFDKSMISFQNIDMGRQLQPSGQRGYSLRTLSLIRQVVQKMFNRWDNRLHGPDPQALI
jgi:hypothetical protein